MKLEDLLNPLVIDSVISFGAGFYLGMQEARFLASGYAEGHEKEVKKRFTIGTLITGAMPATSSMLMANAREMALPLYATGIASSIAGLKIGEAIGKRLRKNNSKISEEEQKKIDDYLANMKGELMKGNEESASKFLGLYLDYSDRIRGKRFSKEIDFKLFRQFAETMSYCNLCKIIEKAAGNPDFFDIIIVGSPAHPKAQVVYPQADKIEEIAIRFKHYKAVRYDSMHLAEILDVEPQFSYSSREWNGDAKQVMDLIDAYIKDNTVMLAFGKTGITKEEISNIATKKLIDAYTIYQAIRREGT